MLSCIIFDAHFDLAFNAVDWNRDLRMSITKMRTHEIPLGMNEAGRRTNTVSFSRTKDAVMLQPGRVRGQSKREVTMERVAENVDYICQLAGDCRNVGIGSDLDGGYGYEQTPADFDTIADLQKLATILEKRGYSPRHRSHHAR